MSKRSRELTEGNEEDNEGVGYVSIPSQPSFLIECSLGPCYFNRLRFNQYSDYENHISAFHNNVCNECKKNFPSEKYLNIHLDENHNPLLQLQMEKGVKIFKCFLYSPGGCTKICSTPKKRRLHMIDKHGYPKDFNFDIINKGLRPGSSLLKN